MAINFEEIPSEIEVPLKPSQQLRTVLEEINARQYLVKEREIKCSLIRPFYKRSQKPEHRYNYKYCCVCPRYKPDYSCQHAGNIIIDRDILTPEEHIVYLATPKANFATPRQMPRYFVKKSIIANCTSRIIRLAQPDKKRVSYALNNFNNIISRRHEKTLKKLLEKSTDVEYTTIANALDLLREEKRLRRVAKRKERLQCEKLQRKIMHKQRRQIKKIIYLLFEDMKDFLLKDQFVMNENSALPAVILEALKKFADKEFNMSNNLREYQKVLATNLAVWINKFISNLNIYAAENEPQSSHIGKEKPKKELSTFLPVDDYILHSNDSAVIHYADENEEEYEEEDEDYSLYPVESEMTIINGTNN